MSKTIAIFVAAAVSAAAASPCTVASAAPASGAFAIKNAAPISVENARWVGGWRGGGAEVETGDLGIGELRRRGEERGDDLAGLESFRPPGPEALQHRLGIER